MRNSSIRAVLFDMGGTLEDVYYDDQLRLQATRGFRDLLAQHDLDPGLSVPALNRVLIAGMKRYQEWRLETEQDLGPERLWSEFVFVNENLPKDKLASIGEELAFHWDQHFSKRVLRPEVPTLLETLRQRGLRLGVISNITSRRFVPHQLAKYGIASYFDVVVTSAALGWRKPNLCIFLEAARLVGCPPHACAYVGDTVSRDVIGARRAGYGLVIQIKSFLTAQSDSEKDVAMPDAVVQNMMQVVDLVNPSASVSRDRAHFAGE